MITIENRVGRLMEACFEGDIDAPQVKVFSSQLAELVVRAGHTMVFTVDFRTSSVVDSQIESMFVGQVRSDNWTIERSAFLVRPETPVSTQIERIISLGKNPRRRSFSSSEAMFEWLRPVLTAEEVARAVAFLAERL